MNQKPVLPTPEQLVKHIYESVVPDKERDEKDTRSTLRRVYIVESLAKRGLLGAPEVAAAAAFSRRFRRAHLEGLRASSMAERVDGGGGDHVTMSVTEARSAINDAMRHLGGGTAAGASILWHVLGLEHSVTRWIKESNSPFNNKEAVSVLVASLQHLARYWGY